MLSTSLQQVSIKVLRANNVSFSPSQYEKVAIRSDDRTLFKDYLDRTLMASDKGTEVGSLNYVGKSSFYFIRNKCIQPERFLPFFGGDGVVPILPSCFKQYDLKANDILISKDSNIGEAVILDKDYPNYMISGGIYRLPTTKRKYYLLAFLKNDFFRRQLHALASKGATIKHAKTLFLDCRVPLPAGKDRDQVITSVEMLVKAIIDKEIDIRKKHESIFQLIKNELRANQKRNSFAYEFPNIKDLLRLNRINAGIYSKYFSENEFFIKNYKHGYKNIRELGFDISRGQNLQVSCIGKSTISDKSIPNFYTLILPKNITYYGTVKKSLYLGNLKELKTLKAGDIIFGAEGYEKGRSIVIFEDRNKTITNIHGITLNHSERNMTISVFVKCFLDYLRRTGLVDLYAVGGNGGSLAQKYWDVIPFPNFPISSQLDIVRLYNNEIGNPPILSQKNDTFLQTNRKWNEQAGIVQIDHSIQLLKERLDVVIEGILHGETVKN